jgi:proteasome accessory factor C
VLDLPASARWVVESYPVEWTEADGRLRVTMHVLGTAWLERLLLRVGADARVVEPAAMVDVGRDAAARLLTEYGEA